MTKPTPADVEGWSDVDFAATTSMPVQTLIDRAWAYLAWTTGQDLVALPDSDPLVPLIQQALQAKAEALAYANSADLAETAADFMLIASFSAGPYSETRRSLTDLKNAGMIDADPRVNTLLWPLLTDERRDEWLGWINGTNAPAFEIVEFDWSASLDGVPADRIYEDEPWSMYF